MTASATKISGGKSYRGLSEAAIGYDRIAERIRPRRDQRTGRFFVALRMDGPLKPWINKTWRPSEVEPAE